MKIKSIRIKLLVILVPLFLIFLGILSGVSYYFSRQTLTTSVNETAMAVGTDYGQRVEADMAVLGEKLKGVANQPSIRAGSDPAQITQLLKETKQADSSFDAVVYVALNGNGLTSEGTTANYGDRDYFKKILSTKQPVVSDPLISKSTGKLAVVLVEPVVSNGQMSGMILGTVSLERLTGMIQNLKFLKSGYGQIADASGKVIAHPTRPELVGKMSLVDKKANQEIKDEANLDDRLTQLVKGSLNGIQMEGVYSLGNGDTRVAVTTPIKLPGDQRWVMVVAAPD